MSPETLESFKSFCEIAGVVVLGLAFLFGAGALWMANSLGAIKERELNNLKLETAHANEEAGQANERAAKLEVEAAKLRFQLEQEMQKRSPRALTSEQKAIMAAELKGKVSKVTFVVQKDLESKAFALQLEVIFQDAGAKIFVSDMAAGEVPHVPPGVLMYKPGGATGEDELKDDPVYKALKKAKLFGGTASQPFASLERGPQGPMLQADGYVLYVVQKMPW